MKYISKPEDSLHSKLAIAAAVRKDISVANTSRSADFDLGKSMLIKTSNKLDSHREVGLPEIVSHLLDFPNHYTGASFRKVHTMQLLKYITLAYGDDPSNSHHQTTPRADLSESEDDPQSQDTLGCDHDPAPVVDSPQDDAPQSEIIASKGQFVLISKFDDYALIGDDLAECCLYDYCSLFYKKKTQSGCFSFHEGHKQHHSHRQFSATPRFRPCWAGFSSCVKTPLIEMFAANTSVSFVRYSYRGRTQILSNVQRSLGKSSFMNDYRRCRLV